MICSQRAPLERYVKPFDPIRYAETDIETKGSIPQLDITALRNDPEAARKAQEDVKQYQNPVSHRIVSQVGSLLRSNSSESPLSDVRHLIYGGASQTGMLTADYMAVEHNQAYMPDGSPIYAGYWPANNHSQMVVPPDAAVVHVVAEGDLRSRTSVMNIFPVAPPRDDSDEANDRFRRYEIAGAAHSSSYGFTSFPEIFPSVFGAPGVLFEGSPSQFPVHAMKGALLDLLVRWVADGRTPPRAERIFLDGEGIIRRDEWGNALGGVRSTYLDVPVKTYHAWSGETYPQTEVGSEVMLAPEVLRELYSSKEDYLRKVDARLDQLVAEGWFPSDEVDVIRLEAAAVDIPGSAR
jgi:hypothetical protein